ncbi:pyridoxal phosphate-dependent transferase [Xylariaceae sp. FL0662B]|nr:pyridoxal phosphate-dependent transferase [Xylariaceae sp. FL0662B]
MSTSTTKATATPPPKRSINLLRGWPSTTLLPIEALRTASQKVLSDPALFEPGLLYGPDPGYQPLREELARWLAAFYHPHEEAGDGDGDGDASRIAISGGASQSIACILQSFTDPAVTRAVWMVAPCYFLACPIFADAGFEGRMRAVPEDDEGVDLAYLEAGLRAMDGGQAPFTTGYRRYKDPGPDRKIYRHVIYCVPSFSNPSGRTMSLRRREGLVRLAREHDALVICDDVYDFLQWRVNVDNTPSTSTFSSSSSSSPHTPSPPQPPPQLTTALLPRLADLDLALGPSPHDPPGRHFGHAVSNGSFSKVVAPGTRTGWTYSSAAFAAGVSRTGSTRSGGAPSQLCAAVLAELVRAGAADAHLRDVLRPAYARRHARLRDACVRLLAPLGVRVRGDSLRGRPDVYGGYFVWVTLPGAGPPAKAVEARCRVRERLLLGAGDLFEVRGDEGAVRFEHDVRLCFAWEDEEDLVEGVERLAGVIRQMMEEGPESWEVAERGKGEGEGEGDVDQAK